MRRGDSAPTASGKKKPLTQSGRPDITKHDFTAVTFALLTGDLNGIRCIIWKGEHLLLSPSTIRVTHCWISDDTSLFGSFVMLWLHPKALRTLWGWFMLVWLLRVPVCSHHTGSEAPVKTHYTKQRESLRGHHLVFLSCFCQTTRRNYCCKHNL